MQTAHIVNSKKKLAFIAGAIVCLVLSPLAFYVAFGPEQVAFQERIRTRAMPAVVPFALIIASVGLYFFARLTDRLLSLEGTRLQVTYGKSAKATDTVDLSQISAIAAAGKYDREDDDKVLLILKDKTGGVLKLDLRDAQNADISWLREPLQAALKQVGSDTDPDIQRIVAGWFKSF